MFIHIVSTHLIKDKGRLSHLVRSAFSSPISFPQLALKSCEESEVIVIPKYLISLSDQWNLKCPDSCAGHWPTSINASDFDWLIWYPESCPYSSKFLINVRKEEIGWLCQYALFGLRPLYLLILSFGLINGASGSMLIEKSKGLRQSPWTLLKVKKIWTASVHSNTRLWISIYIPYPIHRCWMETHGSRVCQFTVSNALCASKLISILFCMFFFTNLIMFSVLLMSIAPCVPGMKPVWSRWINFAMIFSYPFCQDTGQ